MALIVPLDMLRIQIPLFIHSFAYHGLIISIAIMAILILKKRNNYNFRNTIYLFLFMAFIAEIINVISMLYLFNLSPEEIQVVFMESIEIEISKDPFYDIYKNIISLGGPPIYLKNLQKKKGLMIIIYLCEFVCIISDI